MDVTIINIPDCHKTIRQVDEIVYSSNMFQYFCTILDYRQTFTTALFEYYSTVKGAENGINFIKNRSDKKILLLQLNTIVGNSVSMYNEYSDAKKNIVKQEEISRKLFEKMHDMNNEEIDKLGNEIVKNELKLSNIKSNIDNNIKMFENIKYQLSDEYFSKMAKKYTKLYNIDKH